MDRTLEMNIRKNPWGHADHVTLFGDDIAIVTTPSHGGAVLSNDYAWRMQDEFPCVQPWTADRRYWEEDCDLAVVFLAFPQHFDPETVEAARRTVGRGCNGAERARVFGAPREVSK